jgi:hypothetical protein
MNADYTDVYLTAIAAIRNSISGDQEAVHTLWPDDIKDTGESGVLIVALTHVGAIAAMHAANAEGITPDEYLDRLTTEAIMTSGQDPTAGRSDGGAS